MKRILSAVLLAALCAAILSSTALADVAPPHQPPGSNPGPGNEITQVRMMAETVTIEVLAVDPPQAHVSAFFTMRNLGSETEFMAVRFPIAGSNGFAGFPEIKNVGIKVDNQVTPFERVQGPEPTYGFNDQTVPWAAFNVRFAPDKDVQIKVSYDLDGTGYPQETNTQFYYILSTGAGWNGAIGSGEVILRLPYDANLQNVIIDDTQAAPKFTGREAHWTFSELEPTTQNNFTFDIVKPLIWKQVVTERDNVTRNPQDGEAYGRLGKAYKQALFAAAKGYPRTDAGAAPLYQLSKEAYGKAITLKPDDGLWHAGYAELLLDQYYWTRPPDRPYVPGLDLGLKELALAVKFAPHDSKVKELLENYGYMFPEYIVKKPDGSLDFPSLTQTPTPNPDVATATEEIASPTEPAAASATTAPALPSETPIPATKTAPGPSSPICGGAALILLPLALAAWMPRRRPEREAR